ncbi:putative holin-like toxin, partial [Bacillus haynesii]
MTAYETISLMIAFG